MRRTHFGRCAHFRFLENVIGGIFLRRRVLYPTELLRHLNKYELVFLIETRMVSRLGNACSLPLSYPSRKPALSFRIEKKRPIWLSIIGENAEKVNHVGQNIQFLEARGNAVSPFVPAPALPWHALPRCRPV